MADEAAFFSFLESMLIRDEWACAGLSAGEGGNYKASNEFVLSTTVSSQPSADTWGAPQSVSSIFNTKHRLSRAERTSHAHVLARSLQATHIRRCITNDTYLRRLYLSPRHVMALFPTLSRELLPMMMPCSKRRSRNATSKSVRSTLVCREFELVDANGLRWRILLECSLANGCLHCRFLGGWTHFCRENKVATNDYIVFERSSAQSSEIFARVERAKA